MATHRHTATVVKDIRGWLDFDQKFLAAFVVLLGAITVAIVELADHTISWGGAGLQVGPVALAAAAAYVATSQHRAVIEHDVEKADQIADEAAPVLELAVPEIAPEVKVAVAGIDAITKAIAADPVEDFTAK